MDKAIFLNSCRSEAPDIVVQKYLIDGSTYFFDEYQKGGEFDFKKDIATSLDAHIRDIVIVGSGKLGFSLKPDASNPSLYPFKIFDSNFKLNIELEKSDLDIAVVSGALFDKQLKNIFEHTNSYSDTQYKGKKRNSFANYILKGWLRPDFIPEGYQITSEINLVQEKYKKLFGRNINIGIYKSWFYFEKYHRNNINTIKLNQIAYNTK